MNIIIFYLLFLVNLEYTIPEYFKIPKIYVNIIKNKSKIKGSYSFTSFKKKTQLHSRKILKK